MARSNRFFGLALCLLTSVSFGQATPVPKDAPFVANISSVTLTADDGLTWSADGGLYMNDVARQEEKKAVSDLSAQNDQLIQKNIDLQAKLQDKTDNPDGTPTVVTVVASTVGTVVTAICGVLAAVLVQKH